MIKKAMIVSLSMNSQETKRFYFLHPFAVLQRLHISDKNDYKRIKKR